MNTKLSNAVTADRIKKVGICSLSACLMIGAFLAGKHVEKPAPGDMEIASTYYTAINRALSLEANKSGVLHQTVLASMGDNRISYKEYGVILESMENFLDAQSNPRIAELTQSRRQLLAMVGSTNQSPARQGGNIEQRIAMNSQQQPIAQQTAPAFIQPAQQEQSLAMNQAPDLRLESRGQQQAPATYRQVEQTTYGLGAPVQAH